MNEESDPECRTVAQRTLAQLQRIVKETSEVAAKNIPHADAVKAFSELCAGDKPVPQLVLEYVAHLSLYPINNKDFEYSTWSATLMPHLAPYLTTAGAEKVVKAAIERFVQETAPKAVVDDDADTPDLCNCEFTLAYGGKILLKNARLWLKQGRRYGLCGPNGAGKSTLMRAIANGQLDGFPPKDVLRTVYVARH